jgi:ADP-L-glycero-D-manno-heptose 6-epimerase
VIRKNKENNIILQVIMNNYEIVEGGVIKQKIVSKITYDFVYSNDYNKHGERQNYLSYLRYGTLIGVLQKIPESIVDVGYGNGSFLEVCKQTVKNTYGCDISEYPVPEGCKKIDFQDISNVEVVCFFDSLEHFDDISVIKNLDTQYIYISVPWCHNFSETWFLNWHHLKPNEHLWHFKKESLINHFDINGYDCIHTSNVEDIIRKNSTSKTYPNILSCVFKKRDNVRTKLLSYYAGKKILVTGGTGFIGRNIVHELLNCDVTEVVIFDRTIKHTWDDARVKYIKGDLLYDFDILKDIDFDIAFHQAANVDTTCTDEDNMIRTNYDSFVKLVKLCSEKNAKLVYASSAATYGNTPIPNQVGSNEYPINIYGKSKLRMDNYIRENKDSLKNTVVGLRYFNVYGPGEEAKGKMMSMIGQMILKIKEGLDVRLFEFGEQTRDFVYVKDVVVCNLLAGIQTTTGVYNCGYGDYVSFNKIFEILKSFYKNESKIIYITQPYDFFQVSTKADISETSNDLGYHPLFDISKGIYEYINNLS